MAAPNDPADDDFEYRPLVAAGEDREARLAEVIERWATETAEWTDSDGHFNVPLQKIRASRAALVGIDLRDDNEGAEPIDLGRDLLRPLALRLKQKFGEVASVSLAEAALFDCKVYTVDAKGLDAPLGLTLAGYKSLVVGQFDCAGIKLSGDARFGGTTFVGDAWFTSAVFEGTAGFGSATFCNNAHFSNASFCEGALFDDTTFKKTAEYLATHFVSYAHFSGTKFYGAALFDSAKFDNDVLFFDTAFGKGSTLEDATCEGEIGFDGIDLRNVAVARMPLPLRVVHADEQLRRRLTDWANWPWVREIGELTALTRVSYLALIGVPLLAGLWGPLRRGIAWLNGTLDETRLALEAVQLRLTELQAPVSEEALAAIRNAVEAVRNAAPEAAPAAIESLNKVIGRLREQPEVLPPETLAALNNIAQQLEGTVPEAMPLGWLLAFLAALAAAIAQLVYQLSAPQLIREASVDDLLEAANERNRSDGEITDERLREAIGYLHDAADALPHRRSAWFVQRNKRTVWIPDQLELFEPVEEVAVPETALEENAESSEPKETQAPPTGGEADRNERLRAPEVRPEDRKRIAIEEGERARYAVAAFEDRAAAWMSGGLYGVAGWLLLMIALRQLAHVAEASAAPWLAPPFYGASNGWLIGIGTLSLLAATFAGTLIVAFPSVWTTPYHWIESITKRLKGKRTLEQEAAE